MSQEEQTLIGVLEKIIRSFPETGFMIGGFREEKTGQYLIIKGSVFNVNENDILQIKGHWEQHRIYGKQFSVSEFMPTLPQSVEGIERYLSSDMFHGIGKATAKRIVEKFGEDTFRIIDESPQELLKVERFTKKHLQAVLDVHEEQKELRELLSFLYSLGISQTYARKIYNFYGISCVPVIQSNPYTLTEIQGIGFLTADQVASRLGFGNNSPERAVAGLLYMLEQLAQSGHTCYPRELLLEKTSQDLHIEQPVLQTAITQLLADHSLKERLIIRNEQTLSFIARPRYYYAEKRTAEALMRIFQSSSYTRFEQKETLISRQEARWGMSLDAIQREAIQAALEHKVLIITGGPGTGKTTIIRFILELIKPHIPSIALAAPTGRAAKRLTETTGMPAVTIHRMLEYGRQGFVRNRDNPLETELLIVDETSMIDCLLMDALMDALPVESRLILVGDIDQLPSVGPGTVLQDLIHSGEIPVIRLQTIFRQSNNSLITLNAHKVRKGEYPEIHEAQGDLADFYFIRESDQDAIVAKILTMVTERIPQRFGFDAKLDIQVLSPMHRGLTGTIALNARLQAALNPSDTFLEHRDYRYSKGDKVMQQQNSYDKEVFNGDVGIVMDCNPKTKELWVQYDVGIVHYDEQELDQILLAYAISVHKSQGSEYPAVIVPVTAQHYVMLQRNLLYTAITRGKKLVILIGTPKALKLAVDNASPMTRYTALLDELNARHR
ncbi:MAG: ATP-dependent RecD-like DNA helicase [SAR324 cluster bacterium]|nr:ATP-dependent RecD-like DNA helicase [SAR324 cluster bacterium]